MKVPGVIDEPDGLELEYKVDYADGKPTHEVKRENVLAIRE